MTSMNNDSSTAHETDGSAPASSKEICEQYIAALNIAPPFAPCGVKMKHVGITVDSEYPASLLFKSAKLKTGEDFHFSSAWFTFQLEEESDGAIPIKAGAYGCNVHERERLDSTVVQEENSKFAYDEGSMTLSRQTPLPMQVDIIGRYRFDIQKREIFDLAKGKTVTADEIFKTAQALHCAPCFRIRGFIFRWKAKIITWLRTLLKRTENALLWLLKHGFGREFIPKDSQARLRMISGYSKDDLKVTDQRTFKIAGHEIQQSVSLTYICLLMVSWIIAWPIAHYWNFTDKGFFEFFPNNMAAFTAFSIFALFVLDGLVWRIILRLLNFVSKLQWKMVVKQPRKFLFLYI